MSYPEFGSALPQTSGTPRPIAPPGLTEGGTMPACQAGIGFMTLMPPPPPDPGPSFQTTSSAIFDPEAVRRVPPQPSENALDAGKSTWACPSLMSSLEPSSPEATQTVTPRAAAVCRTSFTALTVCCVHSKPWTGSPSANPQLIEITVGLFTLSWMAAVRTSTHPRSVKGAK